MFDLSKKMTDADIAEIVKQIPVICDQQELRLTDLMYDMIREAPFYGYRYMMLKQKIALWMPTCGTDGIHMFFNPLFTQSLTDDEMKTVMVHEMYHVVGLHSLRIGEREPDKWNIACDYAINELVAAENWVMPKSALLDSKYYNRTPEEIYDMLPEDAGQQAMQNMNQGDQQADENSQRIADALGESDPRMQEAMDPGRMGGVMRPRKANGKPMTEREIEEAKAKAKVDNAHAKAKAERAEGQGSVSDNIRRLIDELYVHRIDWKNILNEEMRDVFAQNDYTWTKFNRRQIWRGMYMPGWEGVRTGYVAIAIDTSGSISQEMLQQFMTELQYIVDEIPSERLRVIYCDSSVRHEEDYGEINGVKDVLAHAQVYGGGGTCFEPVFDLIGEDLEPPQMMIYFTDLCGSFPREEPEYPVIWGSYHTGGARPPWGREISLD